LGLRLIAIDTGTMDASLEVAYTRRYTYAASCRVACSVPRLGFILSIVV
jgi:hypothetical protein